MWSRLCQFWFLGYAAARLALSQTADERYTEEYRHGCEGEEERVCIVQPCVDYGVVTVILCEVYDSLGDQTYEAGEK
jgi:hypothetical protein